MCCMEYRVKINWVEKKITFQREVNGEKNSACIHSRIVMTLEPSIVLPFILMARYLI